jgi:hypothetical protein
MVSGSRQTTSKRSQNQEAADGGALMVAVGVLRYDVFVVEHGVAEELEVGDDKARSSCRTFRRTRHCDAAHFTL